MYFGAIDHFTHIRDGVHDWHHNDVEQKEEGYSTHLVTREACRLIESQPSARPLFLYVPTTRCIRRCKSRSSICNPTTISKMVVARWRECWLLSMKGLGKSWRRWTRKGYVTTR